MRALNKGWIGIALIILFGASLFFFRGSSRYSNLFNSDNFVANVSGTQISTSQFLRSLEMNIGQFAQMIGEDLSGDQIRAFQIHQLVLQNLISNAIFENEFDKIDYVIDDTIIASNTKKRFPNLYLNNKINDEALNTFLRQQRLKIDDVVNIIDYETRASVFDSLFFDKLYPIELARKITLANNQSRNIELLKVQLENINLDGLIVENINKENLELLNYYKENSIKYMSDEKRDISYLLIDKTNYKKNFIPSESEIADYFRENNNFFLIPEKRSFKQFNFKSKDNAENFRLKILGLSIDEITKIASESNIKFNEFKNVDRNQVLDELSNVIFSLNETEVSNVVSTTLADHVIVLDKITLEKQPLLTEVSNNIKETLTNVQLDNFFNDLKLKVNQQILDGLNIVEIASINNLVIKNIKKVKQNTENENNLELSIINSAFAQNKNFISDILDYNGDISFIINVDEIYPSEVQNIESIFDIILKDFINFKKINFSREIFDANKVEKNFKRITSKFMLEPEIIDVNLNSEILPNQLLVKIFDTDLDDITFFSDKESVYFAKVNKIKIDESLDVNQNINLVSEIKNAFGSEMIKAKKININDELINGLLSQYK